MEPMSSTAGKPGKMDVGDRAVDTDKSFAENVSIKTRETVELAQEIGSEALDQVDAWIARSAFR